MVNVIYFLSLFIFFCISIFIQGRVPANIGWRTSVGIRNIVTETGDLESYDQDLFNSGT